MVPTLSAHCAKRLTVWEYDRLLFGTDYPGIGPASDIAAVMFEPLSDCEREAIFYKNASRLLDI